jgi:predicted transcriptional regulator
MGAITLDDRDRAVLEALREGRADPGTLADRAGCDPGYLRDRLPDLADNGLVVAAEGTYELTENGRRLLAASPLGAKDDRIDTPAAVEDHLESQDLRPDREDAVRGAFAFLQYWGAASPDEIVDGIYSEHPAGFDSGAAWWSDCVRDRLADLPAVEPPEGDDGNWRFTGSPAVEAHVADGRVAPDDPTPEDTSEKFARERGSFESAERAAVRAAFDRLAETGGATDDNLRSSVYPDYPAGFDSSTAWWQDCVGPAFERLSAVERADGGRWRYREDAVDSESTARTTDVPEDLFGPTDGDEE